MNHDHSQPDPDKPAPESRYGDQDDRSLGGDHDHHATPITVEPNSAALDHHGEHGTHLGHDGHGDHAAQFRNRFWLTLALTIPVVIFSGMFADLLGYPLPDFIGADWIPPVLGTVIFLYGGAPFLTGAWAELRKRQPGMMLLIAMAITVAFVASWATTLGYCADSNSTLDIWHGLAP